MWKKTKSSFFLLRPIGLINKKEKLDSCQLRVKYGVVNAYVCDKDHFSTITKPVYVLFKPDNLSLFGEFVQSEYENQNSGIVEDYDYPEGHIVLLYKFPKQYENDYDLVLNGRYSYVSQDFKKTYPLTMEGGKPNIYGSIFNKDPELRKKWENKLDINIDEDVELFDIFNLERETLDINKILQYA